MRYTIITMAKYELLEWLILWLLETSLFYFDWDRGNSSKNQTKHNVTIDEIEEVFRLRKTAPLGRQVEPKKKEETFGIIGATKEERVLMIAFTIRNEKVRPISARPASKKERSYYEAYLREIS